MSLLTTVSSKLQVNTNVSKGLVVIGVGAALLALRIIVKKINSKINKRPPQLYGLPVIGSLITKISQEEQFLTKTLPSYGDIVRFKFGPIENYVMNDIKLIKKVFAKALDRSPLVC